MSTALLGRLEKVDLRTAWQHEASHFTPWLAQAENLKLLADTIGIPSLEIEAVERPVGPYSADILAKEADTGTWVLIENQLEPTDHKHLGQLLTYAAGLGAQTIIWIAERFTEEHRAAIDFLNRATLEGFSFFAIEIELYRIGDSQAAPRFSIIAKPNNWTKRAEISKQSTTEDDENSKIWREYWTKLIQKNAGRFPALATRSPYRTNWQTLAALRGGNPNFALNAVFSSDRGLRLDISIDGTLAKQAFNQLLNNRDLFETEFGATLEWHEMKSARACRISFYPSQKETRDSLDRWDTQQDWILTWAPKLRAAFKRSVDTLTVSELSDADFSGSDEIDKNT